MAYLIDTSILARLANSSDVQYPFAIRAVMDLHRGGETLHVAPQNLLEFRNAATRPAAQNGLGLTAAEASMRAAIFEAAFPLLVETPAIYLAWKSLVDALGVIGKQVHDARLVACCRVYGISHLLTFNTAHFTRLATVEPGLAVVAPVGICMELSTRYSRRSGRESPR